MGALESEERGAEGIRVEPLLSGRYTPRSETSKRTPLTTVQLLGRAKSAGKSIPWTSGDTQNRGALTRSTQHRGAML